MRSPTKVIEGSAPINPVTGKAVIFSVDDGLSQLGKSQVSKQKKPKKKKKKVAKKDGNDDFFNNGTPGGANGGDPVDKDLLFEGGDEDDFFAVDDAAECQSNAIGKKKKKKKKGLVLPPVRAGPNQQPFNFEEIPLADDNDDGLAAKSSTKKSSRSKSRSSRSKTPTKTENDLIDASPSQKSKASKKKKKKSTTLRSRSNTKKTDDEDLPPQDEDQEAQVIKGRGGMNRVVLFSEKGKKNQDEVVEIGGGKGNYYLENGPGVSGERLDTQSKGFETLMNEEMEKQKSELGKKKKRAAAVKKKKEEKKKKGDYYEQEAANCIQFCIWNCKEGHRCFSLIKKYNQFLSRSSRIVLLISSWMMFIMITGQLMQGKTVSINILLS